MNFIILDLEWNGIYAKKTKGYFNEIIEIGAVKINEEMQQADEFHAVIKPVVGHKLSSLVQNLTGIEEGELAEGQPFTRAVSQLRKWIAEPDAVVMTWSTTDLMVLLENCRYFLKEERIPFMNRYADLQNYCQRRLEYGSSQQLGLGKACELLKIDGDELSPHRALDDSILSGRIFVQVFEPHSFKRTVHEANKDFYDRLTFKTTIISDIRDAHIKRADLRFRCTECDRPLRRVGEWKFKSRAFIADFVCRGCDRKFLGRVQVKLKYDGAETKRRLILKLDEEPKDAAEASEKINEASE